MSKNQKIGTGAAGAALRQGAKELGAALKAFPDSLQVDEYGAMGIYATPGEIAAAKGEEVSAVEMNQEPATLNTEFQDVLTARAQEVEAKLAAAPREAAREIER